MKKSCLVLATIVFVVIIAAIPVAATSAKIGGTYHIFQHYETAYIKDPIYDSNGNQANQERFFKIAAETHNKSGYPLKSAVIQGLIIYNTTQSVDCDSDSSSTSGFHVGYIAEKEGGKILMAGKGYD